jgi:hypothetical protein
MRVNVSDLKVRDIYHYKGVISSINGQVYLEEEGE